MTRGDAGRSAVLAVPLRFRVLVALVVAGLAAAGCSSGRAKEPVPPPVPRVDVEILDGGLEKPARVPAGRVVFRITNAGRHVHRLALIPLPDDFPPLAEEVANATERTVEFLARVGDIQPGKSGQFAVDLTEGQRYGLVDYSLNPEGVRHLKTGVAGEFVAGARDQPSPSHSPFPAGTSRSPVAED